MNTTQQVAPGWQRSTIDGKAVYNQVATAEPTFAVARPVDVQRLATDAMSANSAMVTAILRSMTPAVDAEPGNRARPGLSSPAELAARNERFRWTTAATVALSAVTAGGICWVAYLAGAVNEPGALAGWLTLAGLAGYASVQWIAAQRRLKRP